MRVNGRRNVAAFAVTIGTTIAGAACALPNGTVDPGIGHQDEAWSVPPSWHPVPPIRVPAEANYFGQPSGAGGRPPDPTTSVALSADMPGRVDTARAMAAARGADVAVSLLDRTTGERVVADGDTRVETASLSKLFIADAVLHETPEPSARDRELVARMLRRSDDSAATTLWSAHGGPAIVDAVADRYGLQATTAPWDDNWWNTVTTADDLVDYFSGLLTGTGGLSATASAEILTHLRSITRTAADGYDQWFGIPDALYAQAGDVAAKQGWMCCIEGRWLHLSTAVVGPESRYVVVVVSYETVTYPDGTGRESALPDTYRDPAVDDVSAAHARETITDVVRIMFPEGRIG